MRRRPRERTRRRRPAWLMLGVTGLCFWAVGGALGARADDPTPNPVVLEGSGDADLLAEITGWQDDIFSAAQPVDVQFFQRGSVEGRAQLLEGKTNFTLTGVPFTDAEIAARPAGAGAIISVPISVSALSIVFSTPLNVGWTTFRIKTEIPGCADPDTFDGDPETCYERGEYTGPIRVPAENLSAMITGLSPSFQQNGLASWRNSAIVTALGTSSLRIQDPTGGFQQHSFVEQSQAAADNKYLLEYAKTLGPTAWDLRKQENPQFPWDQAGEVFSPRTLSRNGLETALGVMAIPLNPVNNTGAAPWTGNAGAVPTTYVQRYLADRPSSGFRIAEIQNANDDWVAPTTDSIAAAVAAGGDQPNFATDHPVAGAYPLVWITRMYTVAGTLSPDEANAMAAMVRYTATDGQAALVAHGSAALTPALRDEALAKADGIVVANCTQAGYRVVTDGPSAFEAGTPQVQALTTMKHCEVIPPPPATTSTTSTTVADSTTTTIPDTTTSTTTVASDAPTSSSTTTTTTFTPPFTPPRVAQSSSAGSSSGTKTTSPPAATPSTSPATQEAGPESSVETTVAAATVESSTTTSSTVATGGGGNRPRSLPLRNLPLPVPSDGSGGFKKLGTLMLGAALFLLARQLLASRRALA